MKLTDFKKGQRLLIKEYYSIFEIKVIEVSKKHVCVEHKNGSEIWRDEYSMRNWELAEILCEPEKMFDKEENQLYLGDCVVLPNGLKRFITGMDSEYIQLSGNLTINPRKCLKIKSPTTDSSNSFDLSAEDISRMIAIKKLKSLCDWSSSENYWLLYQEDMMGKDNWGWVCGEFNFKDTNDCYHSTITFRFNSKESAEKAIYELGEEKLNLLFDCDWQ